MAGSDFDIRLRKEAKTSLQSFRNQSLLRRKFGDDAVKLYDMIDSTRSVAEILAQLHMSEGKFVEILEFMNNNGMVSAAPEGEQEPASSLYKAPSGEKNEPAPLRSPIKPAEISPKEKREEEATDVETLSPLEKILYDKYGIVGVKIYNLIDGEKTAEEILKSTGVSEAQLVEILEFMDEQGIIKLEKPSPEAEEAEAAEKKEAGREPRFKPLTEEEPEEKPYVAPPPPSKKEEELKKEEEAEAERAVTLVDVPQFEPLTISQKAVLFGELRVKFGKAARQLVDLVDGKRDFVELALGTGLSFFEVDGVMAYFGKKGMLSFKQLTRDDIKKKYGEDGFAIYKRYGREGLLLYEMIGKEASLKDIISKSRLEPDKAVEIFLFIHKVLGLDIPLDRDEIYRQIGMRKPAGA